jgi:hypothetical protein
MAERNVVVRSFNMDGGNCCVDIFRRPDGTYGFEEYRREPEDGSRVVRDRQLLLALIRHLDACVGKCNGKRAMARPHSRQRMMRPGWRGSRVARYQPPFHRTQNFNDLLLGWTQDDEWTSF